MRRADLGHDLSHGHGHGHGHDHGYDYVSSFYADRGRVEQSVRDITWSLYDHPETRGRDQGRVIMKNIKKARISFRMNFAVVSLHVTDLFDRVILTTNTL